MPNDGSAPKLLPTPPPSPEVAAVTTGATWELFTVQPSVDKSDAPFEAVLLRPKRTATGALPPLLVFPHGGPHGTNPTMYSLMNNFFVGQGYAVLLVNFRGSMGFGEAALHSLPGRAGLSPLGRDLDPATNLSSVDASKL